MVYLSGLASWSKLHQALPGSHALGPQLLLARRWQNLEFLLLPVLLMVFHIGALGTGPSGHELARAALLRQLR